MPIVTGTIATAPVDCRLLLLDEALEHAVVRATTSSSTFELDAPGAGGVVLARLRGPVFGAAHAPAAAHVRLDPAVHAPLWPVEIVTEGDVPAQLHMTSTLARIPGFPEGADRRWTYQLADRATEPFATWTLVGQASVVMQEGDWMVDASYRTPVRARGQTAEPARAWSIASARDERGPVSVEGGCVRIRIDRATRLVLVIG